MANVVHVDFRPSPETKLREGIRAQIERKIIALGDRGSGLPDELASAAVGAVKEWERVHTPITITVDFRDQRRSTEQIQETVQKVLSEAAVAIAAAMIDGALLAAKALV